MKYILAPALLLFFIFGAIPLFAQTDQADTVEQLLTRMARLLSEAKYDEAIALFDRLPPAEANGSYLRLLKASVLSSAGRFDEARTLTEAVSAAEPDNIDALLILAAIEEASGRQSQQRAALEKIIVLDPNNEEALIRLGNLCLASRSIMDAASYFHTALSTNPENPDAMIGLARTMRMNREWEAAEPILNHLVSLYPNMVEARSERARFYWGRSFLVQALEDMDEAKRLAPDDYYIALDRANLLLEMNRREQALEEFNRAISINPNDYLPYAYTSGLKDDLGDYEGAERDYAVLARLKPDYVYAFEGLGLHHIRNGEWAEARAAFLEAYRQEPDETLYALLAVISWMRMGDISSPRQYIAQVQTKIERNTLEWYMFRLYYDMTVRNYVGESDIIIRLDREQNEELKARMLFYMAMYYDIRGNTTLANKYFVMFHEMDKQAIPEWRLNRWIVGDRNLIPF